MMVTPTSSDQLDTCFDDTHAIANAGLLLAATPAERLGIQQTADQLSDLGERPGAAHPGRKLLTWIHRRGNRMMPARIVRKAL
jgi:hypothetical protein